MDINIDTKKKPESVGAETSSVSVKSEKTSQFDYTPDLRICQAKNAEDKINAELKKTNNLSRAGKVVAEPVADALKEFCRQNAEFAQAVLQSDKTVGECVESTVKNCEGALSDLEVYRRAVQFYFDGADVHMKLTVDLGDGGFSNTPITVNSRPVELSLDSLLDF
jgi:hypothetical protein